MIRTPSAAVKNRGGNHYAIGNVQEIHAGIIEGSGMEEILNANEVTTRSGVRAE